MDRLSRIYLGIRDVYSRERLIFHAAPTIRIPRKSLPGLHLSATLKGSRPEWTIGASPEFHEPFS
jgi:hypothetical protein